jgi:hypothetical protein
MGLKLGREAPVSMLAKHEGRRCRCRDDGVVETLIIQAS